MSPLYSLSRRYLAAGSVHQSEPLPPIRGDRSVGVGPDLGVVPVPLDERLAVGARFRSGEVDLLLFEHADRVTADVPLVGVAVAGLEVVDDDAAQRALAFRHAAAVAPPGSLVVDQHRNRAAVLVTERSGHAAGVVGRSEIAFVDVGVAAVGQGEFHLPERDVGVNVLVGELADRLLLADEVAGRSGRLADDVGRRQSAERVAFGIGLLGEGHAVERDFHLRVAFQRVVVRRVELQAVSVAAVEHLHVGRLGVHRVVVALRAVLGVVSTLALSLSLITMPSKLASGLLITTCPLSPLISVR